MKTNGLVILFAPNAHHTRAARLHAAVCNMVNTAKQGRRVVEVEATQDEIDDLNAREWPVKACKCVKDLCGLKL